MSSGPIVVIADDLSGAAELGAIGLRHGLKAEVLLSGEISGNADLVCVDTNSRLLQPSKAAERMKAFAKSVSAANPQWVYKKVDSVLRGNIAVEIEALLQVTGLPMALLVPVNPSLGRIIRDGRYFVHGTPVDKTEFAHDPAHPRKSSHVRELLGTVCKLPIQICKLGDVLPHAGIAVGEAGSVEDLRAWAAQVKPGMLAAGTAEFFAAMLARDISQSPPRSHKERHAGSELFVCGSTSESMRAFIEGERLEGTPVFSLPPGLARGEALNGADAESIAQKTADALQTHPRVILCVGLPLVKETNVAMGLAGHLVHVAAKVVRTGKANHIYAEGGATAMALVREMDWERLVLVREMALGVATVAVDGEESLRFTMKPGSYTWPDEVLRKRLSQ